MAILNSSHRAISTIRRSEGEAWAKLSFSPAQGPAVDHRVVGGGVRLRYLHRARRCADAHLRLSAAGACDGRLYRAVSGHPVLMQLFRRLLRLCAVRLETRRLGRDCDRLHMHAAPISAKSGAAPSKPCPRGQVEAARALSLGYVSRMKDVILPQALRISLPATIVSWCKLIKGTSLAAFVGSPSSPVREAWFPTRYSSPPRVRIVGVIYSSSAGRCRFMARGWSASLPRPRDEWLGKVRPTKQNSWRRTP